MLGRLKMTIEECEAEYERISKDVFDHSPSILDFVGNVMSGDGVYKADKFKSHVQRIVKDKSLKRDPHEPLQESVPTGQRQCKT
jgi:hypothetical protein